MFGRESGQTSQKTHIKTNLPVQLTKFLPKMLDFCQFIFDKFGIQYIE
jgi:hypothetical protein